MPEPRQLVLASTSRYRRELLQRLALPFECADPRIEENALDGEGAEATARRLAMAKARAVAGRFADALIVGADQVAYCGAHRLDKPRVHEHAARQLALVSGKVATFETAVALLDARREEMLARVVRTRVRFRRFSPATIEAYLRQEQPYDCAGSAKAEGLGIALLERVESDDPTALIGLPLIALTELLTAAGMPVLPA